MARLKVEAPAREFHESRIRISDPEPFVPWARMGTFMEV
jgi:hypothetical protein